MSLSAEERQKGIQPLTKDNYLVWSEMIKDCILCLECEDAEDTWEQPGGTAKLLSGLHVLQQMRLATTPSLNRWRTLLITTMLFRRAPPLIRWSRHAMLSLSPTFAVRCHLRSS